MTSVLKGWPYEADELQVRIVPGDDGREKLQMRVDLGVLQMELSGRPDGDRPFGFDSLLEHHEDVARKSMESGEDFNLDASACSALMREGVQYYHRYLSLFHLERYDLVARDTTRNLRLFAFVVKHATRMSDRLQFDQFRPYVTMMYARARGLEALDRREFKEALQHIDVGIDRIRDFLREYDQADREGDCRELKMLIDWRRQIESDRPVGPLERLEQQLDLAVSMEQYEEAARLRDQIRRLRELPIPEGPIPLGES